MGICNKWSNVPVYTMITINRVTPDNLPTFFGKSDALDKAIEGMLASKQKSFWITQQGRAVKDKKVLELFHKIEKEYPEEIECIDVELTAKSTGYYDAGCTSGPIDGCYPPEGEDDREASEISLIINNDKTINIEEKDFPIFEYEFDAEMYSAELPEPEPELPEPEPDDDW